MKNFFYVLIYLLKFHIGTGFGNVVIDRGGKNDSLQNSKIQAGFHPRRQTRFNPFADAPLPPFEFALMFSIKSKGHSDGGRCARNPNRGHKPSKGSARIAAKCLSSCHYAAVARESKLPSRSQHWGKILSSDPQRTRD